MDTVRITSGEFKGRKIATPGGGAHPMGERERIALFNMISEFLPGASVLDAFSGSGALGIEAISRGAKSVLFIDKNTKACATIKDNLKKLGISSLDVEVLKTDLYQVLGDTTDRFSVVLADPPYDEYNEEKIKILARVVAAPGGVLVLSHPEEAPEMPGLSLLKTRKYAAAHISIYTK